MIKNERQYRITRTQAEHFFQALYDLDTQESNADAEHPLFRKAKRDAVASQLEELQSQLREYEDLIAGRFEFDRLNSVAELPAILVKARIARGMSQRQLADLLGLKEQQIQRYEATDFVSASLARIKEIADVLSLNVEQSALFVDAPTSLQMLATKVSQAGLPAPLVRRRLIPRQVWRLDVMPEEMEQRAVSLAVESIGRVFQWSPEQLLQDDTLDLEPALGGVRFKTAANADPHLVSAYAVYAHYLSMLVMQVCGHQPVNPVPANPDELRSGIDFSDDSTILKSIVNRSWDLGVPVLPLDDPGSFHGACFREGGRNVVVLKQRTSSESRWAYDLLHELWHAGQEPGSSERTVLEADEMSEERRQSPEEITANRFAAAVLLDGRSQQLAETCLSEAGGNLRRLKAAVQRVAVREGVPVGALANYLAHRLAAEQGLNWWGTANNLQVTGKPWNIVRDVFFERSELGGLAEPDRELLAQALTSWEEEERV